MRDAQSDGPPVPIDVSDHACWRYRQRIDGSASDETIRARLIVELQDAGPSDGSGYPPDCPIALGIPDRYVAILVPDDPPTVATVWRWDDSPHLLKRKGGPEVGVRHYRWLNDGLSWATVEDVLNRVMEAETLSEAREVARGALPG